MRASARRSADMPRIAGAICSTDRFLGTKSPCLLSGVKPAGVAITTLAGVVVVVNVADSVVVDVSELVI